MHPVRYRSDGMFFWSSKNTLLAFSVYPIKMLGYILKLQNNATQPL